MQRAWRRAGGCGPVLARAGHSGSRKSDPAVQTKGHEVGAFTRVWGSPLELWSKENLCSVGHTAPTLQVREHSGRHTCQLGPPLAHAGQAAPSGPEYRLCRALPRLAVEAGPGSLRLSHGLAREGPPAPVLRGLRMAAAPVLVGRGWGGRCSGLLLLPSSRGAGGAQDGCRSCPRRRAGFPLCPPGSWGSHRRPSLGAWGCSPPSPCGRVAAALRSALGRTSGFPHTGDGSVSTSHPGWRPRDRVSSAAAPPVLKGHGTCAVTTRVTRRAKPHTLSTSPDKNDIDGARAVPGDSKTHG